MWNDLRLTAGYPSNEAVAAAWGRSARQIRRWARGDTPVPRWAWRLISFEAGIIPGWPRGWRARRDGVYIPGLGLAQISEIEARGYVWELIRDDLRDQAEAVYCKYWRNPPSAACAASNSTFTTPSS